MSKSYRDKKYLKSLYRTMYIKSKTSKSKNDNESIDTKFYTNLDILNNINDDLILPSKKTKLRKKRKTQDKMQDKMTRKKKQKRKGKRNRK